MLTSTPEESKSKYGKTIVCIEGDGYSEQIATPWLNFLQQHGYQTIFVPLIESDPNATYEELRAPNYCKYVDGYIPRGESLILYGQSKGCHIAMMYATRNAKKFREIVLLENTMMNKDLMVEFEKDRGNDYVEDYAANPKDIPGLDATEKMLDIAVSDPTNYCPRGIPIKLIWTSRNNQNEPYSADVVAMKKKYESYLRSHGSTVKVYHLNSDHCADTHPEYFPKLLEIIED